MLVELPSGMKASAKQSACFDTVINRGEVWISGWAFFTNSYVIGSGIIPGPFYFLVRSLIKSYCKYLLLIQNCCNRQIPKQLLARQPGRLLPVSLSVDISADIIHQLK